ncbi:AP2 domain-containing protein [bacterium]|nr:AP2 domain-containing protein [bacterium]
MRDRVGSQNNQIKSIAGIMAPGRRKAVLSETDPSSHNACYFFRVIGMPKKIEMIGRKFGRWTVKADAGKKGREFFYKCECSCGTVRDVLGSRLRHGGSQSCGCIKPEATRKALTTHGKRYIPEYKVWSSMLQRCSNPNNCAYDNYGGRGIFVCQRWLVFANFFDDMGKRPKGFTIERINNNKGYYKGNCKWATVTEQSHNHRARKSNTTGFVGVRWNKKLQKYQAGIGENYKRHHLGTFNRIEDAISARKQAEQKYWGATCL